ncbi:response regulator [Tellurirhabdus bombi]|uniref:response regulator n=1 Tax=Tellurirhabdus bombi TaxID=2907205 RepID=UPI001F23D364|nr:response regulator [Tellurirhabdus bombi]
MEPTTTSSKPTIVLVDDDEEDRMLMRMALESIGLESSVVELESGEHLLRYLTESLGAAPSPVAIPWIVVLDKFMPGLSGFDTLRQLKSHEVFQHIPVVLFVNTQNKNEIDLCVDLGAMTCTSKPLSFDDMKELMKTVYDHWQERFGFSKQPSSVNLQ